jgi:2'-5' RNA ligase
MAQELAQVAGGRPVPAEKLHLTLAFLGEVDESRMALLPDCARIGAAHFRLELDRVGSFRRARVAWAGASAPPRTLLGMQAMLAGASRPRGFPWRIASTRRT